jgi:uncharacterized protein
LKNEIITVAGHLGVLVAFGGLGAVLFRRSFRLSWFLAGLALYVIDDALLTRGFFLLPKFPGAEWNWAGKLMSFAGMLAIAALPAFGWRRTGITLVHRRGSWPAYLVFTAFFALFFFLAVTNADGRDDWETIAFQWTMPGLDEELFYRGVLLVAMNEAFGRKASMIGVSSGYGGALTCLLFGLIHALSFDDGAWSFDASAFLLTGGPSVILLWLRERTGSLLLPVLAHNVANGAGTLF